MQFSILFVFFYKLIFFFRHFILCYSMVNEARKVTGKIRLSDFFQRIDIVQNKNNYDSFYRGLLTQSSQEQDQYVTEEVSKILFFN